MINFFLAVASPCGLYVLESIFFLAGAIKPLWLLHATLVAQYKGRKYSGIKSVHFCRAILVLKEYVKILPNFHMTGPGITFTLLKI